MKPIDREGEAQLVEAQQRGYLVLVGRGNYALEIAWCHDRLWQRRPIATVHFKRPGADLILTLRTAECDLSPAGFELVRRLSPVTVWSRRDKWSGRTEFVELKKVDPDRAHALIRDLLEIVRQHPMRRAGAA